MGRTRAALATLALTSLLALTSCSSVGAADSRTAGVPDHVDLPAGGEGPYVIAMPDGSVQVVTFGSSSCPPTATSFENDGSEMTISFNLDVGGTCTADINPTTHIFSASKVGSPRPATANVLFPQLGDERVVDVIVAQ